ncbi:sodium:calcium antiporter [Halobacteriaceae archaeon GCM10025711]
MISGLVLGQVNVPFLPPTWENTLLLVASFLLLLLGAEIFTNGVEWLGHHLGVSESATGSILAAVGTALPETMIPVLAIIAGGRAAEEVGVGAILGAPFMLATVAMLLVGSSVLYFGRRRASGKMMHFNDKSTRRDLSFFLVGYSLAFLAALVDDRTITLGIGGLLVLLYLTYLYRSLQSGELVESESLEELHIGLMIEGTLARVPGMTNDGGHAEDPHFLLVGLQTAFALSVIIGGALVFVEQTVWVSEEVLHIPTAVVALLIAPLATELPEKFNSVIWISRDKDTLALGNITGAMAFQGTLPVTLGIVYTSWDLSLSWGTTGFLNGFSAILAIVSGGLLYLRARGANNGEMAPRPFLIGGLFYLLFIVVTVYHVVVLDVQAAGAH